MPDCENCQVKARLEQSERARRTISRTLDKYVNSNNRLQNRLSAIKQKLKDKACQTSETQEQQNS